MYKIFGLELEAQSDQGSSYPETAPDLRFTFVDKRLCQIPVDFSEDDLHNARETFRMNEEHKAEWIRLLLSGEYRQGHSALHEIDRGFHTYCCLGVYCELRELPKVEIPSVNPNEVRFGYGINRERLYLPREIEHEVGGNAYQTALAACNDSKWTFDEIATLLEVAF
jgi:hypothetical protein